MTPETVEEFINRKLSSPEYYSSVSKARRLGIDETDLSILTRQLRTLYYARFGFHGGSYDLIRVLIRDALEELSSRPSKV